MSIISKKRMTRNMLNPLWEAGPDLALLFLCMKLMITRPQEGLESANHPIYTAAKRFLALMESSGMTSLLVLQAHILVALYEIGQAIYPAAWMSAGACVRYGLLLGIHGHESSAQLLGRPVSTFIKPIMVELLTYDRVHGPKWRKGSARGGPLLLLIGILTLSY
jgi:hypothetical protein